MAVTREPPEEFDWRSVTPEDSPKTPMDIRADPTWKKLTTADLQAGDDAYDFSSPIYDFSDGTEKVTGEHFNLTEASREKPVALIFGSYT